MPVTILRLYFKVNGGADRREVSVKSSSCMCNVNKLRLVLKTLSVRKSVPARKVSLALHCFLQCFSA